MHEDKVKEFDLYVQKNYKEIKKSANTICKSYKNDEVDDIINDTYIKLKKKIQRDGFKGKNYAGYYWISIKNEFGMKLRKIKREKLISIDDSFNDFMDYSLIIEKVLLEQHETARLSDEYDNELMDITKDLFEYIEIIFNDREVYLFKNYYLTPKNTYKKLSKLTGYSITECSLTIKEMKKRIREGFIDWYKTKHK